MHSKHAALQGDQEKKGEIDVLNGEGMKQDEIKLLEERESKSCDEMTA